MSTKQRVVNGIGCLIFAFFTHLTLAAGGADGGKTPAGDPDKLTGSVLEDKYHYDTSDHGAGPSHPQINQSDVNANKARLHCMKLTGKAKQDCLAKLD